jgi:hypothetical protein
MKVYIAENADGTVDVTTQCFSCKETQHVQVKKPDFEAWQQGKFVQDAFPYLKPGQRELFISQVCETCFDKFFPAEDDEYNAEDDNE